MLIWLLLGLLPVALVKGTFPDLSALGSILGPTFGNQIPVECSKAKYREFMSYGALTVNHEFDIKTWEKFVECYKNAPLPAIHIYNPLIKIKLPKSDYPIYIVIKNYDTSYNIQDTFDCSEKNTIHMRSEYMLGSFFSSFPSSWAGCANEKSSINSNGYCFLPVPLPRMSMLDHCKDVDYLQIDQNTVLDSTTAKVYFTILSIYNTKLTNLNMINYSPRAAPSEADKTSLQLIKMVIKNIAKLSQGTNKFVAVQENSKLCVPREFEHAFSGLKDYNVANNGNNNNNLLNENCKVECKSSIASKSQTCTVITDDVVVDCSVDGGTISGMRASRDRIPGIGYNYVRLNGNTITIKNCSPYIINSYFSRVINLYDVKMIIINPSNNLSTVNSDLLPPPKQVEIKTDRKIGLFEYASLEHQLQNIYVDNKEEFPEGVCHFSGPAAIEVKGCKRIEGDLFLNESSVSVDPMLEEVNGCIHLTNTNLSNYEFLNNIKNVSVECHWDFAFKSPKNVIRAARLNRQTDAINTCILYEYRQNTLPAMKSIMDSQNYRYCGQQGCVFNSSVEGDTKCKGIDGDLIVGGKTGEIDPVVRFVRGCIHIVNSNLNSYEFLKNIETYSEDCVYGDQTGAYTTAIANNTCIPYLQRQGIKNKNISALVSDKSNIVGCAECKGGKVEELTDGCAVVLGDLVIDKADEKVIGPKIALVREVFGRVVVKNNNNAKKLLFTKLEKITSNDAKNPALEISDNKELETIELPALKKMTSTAGTKVSITKNPKWNPSKALEGKLKQMTGGVCNGKKESACFYERVQEEKKKEPEDEGLSGGAIAGIVIGVLVIIILIGAGGGLIAFFVIRKKKKSKTNANGSSKPPPPGPPVKTGKTVPAKTPTATASKSNTKASKGTSKPSTTALTSKASTDKLGPSASTDKLGPSASTDKLGPSASRSRENLGKTASKDRLTATKSRDNLNVTKSNEALTPAKAAVPQKPAGIKANVKIGVPKPPAVKVNINVKK